MQTPWPALEQIPGLAALPAEWRRVLGQQFGPFKNAFLQSQPDRPARFYPCPNGCGGLHEVFVYGPNDIVAACRCESSICQNLRLSLPDIIPLELSWLKVGRALAQALDLDLSLTKVGLPRTRQIGSWSAGAVPVFLTLQPGTPQLRAVVAELVARLRQPFILLTPGTKSVDLGCRELLAQVGAAPFTLDALVVLTERATLQPRQAPGRLFAQFTPSPAEPPQEDAARRAFALVQQLDPDSRIKPPTLLTVFRLYCIEEMSAGQIARKYACGKTTIMNRLKLIRAKTGVDPEALRRLSPHLAKLEDDLNDSRATRLDRHRVIYGDDPQEAD